MGNSDSKSDVNSHNKPDPLRDYSVNFADNISKPNFNLLLAYTDNYYYPCIIVNKAQNIKEGYLVYFFHNQTETEIPCGNVIGNFQALLDRQVCFSAEGIIYCGKVQDVCINKEAKTTNFFISYGPRCAWVSLPFIFLTMEQARQLL